MSTPRATLILVRHGQSQWNLENRFTGWWDVDLTEQGVAEVVKQRALLRYQTLYQWLALHAAAGTLDDSVLATVSPLFTQNGTRP